MTIPTAVDAWVRLNQDYGSRPLAELLQPAIGYARDGYPVGQRVAFDFAANLALLKGDPDAGAVFLRDGRTLPMGARHTQPQLAANPRADCRPRARRFLCRPGGGGHAGQTARPGRAADTGGF